MLQDGSFLKKINQTDARQIFTDLRNQLRVMNYDSYKQKMCFTHFHDKMAEPIFL